MSAYVLFMVILCSSVAMGEVVRDNLVLELNGASPGARPDAYWQPTVGPAGATGRLEATVGGLLPTYERDTHDGLPVRYYDFKLEPPGRTAGGRVTDLGIEVDSTNPDDFIFIPTKDWTVELWFYPRHEWQSGTEFECLFSTMSWSDGAWGQGVTIKRRMQENYQVGVVQGLFAGENGSSGRHYYLGGTSSGTLQLNEWNQIVLVFSKDDGSGSSMHSWYHNGEFDRTHGEARNLEYPLVDEEFMTPPNQLSVAARFDGTEDEVFNGKVAVVRVYSAALAPEEVAANYSVGIGLVGDVTESEGFTEVQEEGETSDTFDVALTAQPSSDVTVDLVYDANQVSLDPTSLLFASGWDPNVAEPETVTVTAVDDDVIESRIHYRAITLNPTSNDSFFDGRQMPSVSVRVIDDESGVVTVDPTALEVMEEGPTSDSFTVSLSRSPVSDDVVINFSDYDPNQISLSDDSIIFTTANWDTPQTVTVTAIDDNIYEPLNHTTTIKGSVTADSDIAYTYDGQTFSSVVVNIADNECGAGRYSISDLNQDCVVDLADFAIMVDEWLMCTFPTVEGCIEPSRPTPQFRTLFSNDMVNVMGLESPYNELWENTYRKEKIYGSVDETIGTGIDVHMLQPGLGWVPYWKSSIYPFNVHAPWYRERYGRDLKTFGFYMEDGGDIAGEFLQRCREKGIVAFISLRMNDRHQKHYADLTKEEVAEYGVQPGDRHVSKIYMDHPEYRLEDIYSVPDQGDMDLLEYLDEYRDEIRTNRIWNWAIPEVRRHKLDFITEICENYDINGFELDFERHRWLFKDDVPVDERVSIMTGFIRRVREVLDRSAQHGQHRWLSVRIPFRVDWHKYSGADVKSWHDAGVDIFNLSCDFVMQQQHDLHMIHEAVPEAPLYIEVTYTPQCYRPADESLLGDRTSQNLYILTKPEQFYTTAHLAYSRGAKGVTAFNFAYYRNSDERLGGTVAEPPFEVFNILRDPELVAQQPQHYYISRHDYNFKEFMVIPGQNFDETFEMDMAPPKGGWTTDGRLRIQVDPEFGNVPCVVQFNGVQLEETPDISEPYPTELDEGLGNAESLRAWTLPKSLIMNGVNQVRIAMPQGCEGSRLIFLDIGIQ